MSLQHSKLFSTAQAANETSPAPSQYSLCADLTGVLSLRLHSTVQGGTIQGKHNLSMKKPVYVHVAVPVFASLDE